MKQYNRKSIRVIDKDSIRKFVATNAVLLAETVLDFGAGLQPYKDLVTGTYTPYDPFYLELSQLPDEAFDTILCNQVLEEVNDPMVTMMRINDLTKKGGHVIWTFNTLWEEWDGENHQDRWRFTKNGAMYLAEQSGFKVIKTEPRYSISHEDFEWTVGYGFVLEK